MWLRDVACSGYGRYDSRSRSLTGLEVPFGGKVVLAVVATGLRSLNCKSNTTPWPMDF